MPSRPLPHGLLRAFSLGPLAGLVFVTLRVVLPVVLPVALLLAVPAPHAEVIYVDTDATGQGNGTSWEDAFTDLQLALEAAPGAGDQIWVATGLYHPSAEVGGAGPRYACYSLRNGVALYGGFAGDEEALEERDPDLHPVTLSGDVGVAGEMSDNCYHVFYHPADSNLDETAVLDGFVVTAGCANESGGDCARGGGMYNEDASPTIANCVFTSNEASADYYSDGGAVCNQDASPRFTGCVFTGNLCGRYGGAVANMWNASPVFEDCAFSDNHAGLEGSANGFAGAMYSYGTCSPVVSGCSFTGNSVNFDGGAVGNDGSGVFAYFVDCRFSDNTAVLYGGAVYNRGGADPTYVQCVFEGNQGTASNAHGGAMYNHNACPVISNCVVYDNESGCVGDGIYCYQFSDPVITNSIILGEDGIYSGGGSEPSVTYCAIEQSGFENPEWHNIAGDPGLVDPAGGDFHLSGSSPCIDAGSNDALPPDVADLDGDGDTTEPIPLDSFGDARRHDMPDVPDTGQGEPPIVDIGIHELSGSGSGVPERAEAIPVRIRPNPVYRAGASTSIEFDLAVPARVTVAIYDANGRLIRTLADGVRPAGPQVVTWQGRNDGGRPVASGVYACVLRTGERAVVRWLTLVR